MILDAALQAATGLQQPLSFRRACTTAASPAEQQDVTGTLLSAAAELTAASGRTGTTHLS